MTNRSHARDGEFTGASVSTLFAHINRKFYTSPAEKALSIAPGPFGAAWGGALFSATVGTLQRQTSREGGCSGKQGAAGGGLVRMWKPDYALPSATRATRCR